MLFKLSHVITYMCVLRLMNIRIALRILIYCIVIVEEDQNKVLLFSSELIVVFHLLVVG
jgi:hypothetical protein